MRKETRYKVSGLLETKPSNLPEGVSVEEVKVDAVPTEVSIIPIHGGSGKLFRECSYLDSPAISFDGGGIFAGEEVRRLRDFLNVVLNESKFKGRVLVDFVGDVWFEFHPDVWTQGNDFTDTNPNPWERANERHGTTDDAPGLTRQTLSEIERRFGPVRFIANIWE